MYLYVYTNATHLICPILIVVKPCDARNELLFSPNLLTDIFLNARSVGHPMDSQSIHYFSGISTTVDETK